MFNKQMTPEQQFEAFLREVRPAGDFVTIEQLFVDMDCFTRMGMPAATSALVASSAHIHGPDCAFIQAEHTTPTEVYLEVYRQAFYDHDAAIRNGGMHVYASEYQREFILGCLRSFFEDHLKRLPQDERQRITQGTSNVVQLASFLA